ncbi:MULTISPECIES: hypothetical protein [unclassified Novosphingobium]|uniref:hypothetical protein n=1 Tax=unclassified Novosphingobium TaxID=2644732 RepID=UPI00144766E3|nr:MULTISPECIES: hypothetical protein [unclassified Novosphingobium]NKJ43592.1 hypothetical protein [Novosphingobium sp. SG720]NMN06088.1 hypothetical protein [Novosphingobium sp. SG919]NMN88385.1 hypothetical protein [Novosphingobium sp. SG916]
MLATLASLVIAGAGVAALVAVAATWRGQLGAIRQLLADARALEQADALDLDRAFLARLVECPMADPAALDPAAADPAPALRPVIRNVRRVAPRAAPQPVVTGPRRAAA